MGKNGAAKSRSELAANIAASGFTGFAVMVATNPLDTIKQRFQIGAGGSGGGSSSLAAFFSRIVESEGFYRGLWKPGVLTNACCCTVSVGIRIGFYPFLRDSLGDMPVLAGLASGGAGYFCAAPLFHAKNRIQVTSGLISADGSVMLTGARKGMPPAPQNGVGVLLDVMQTDGILAWWRGAHLLVARGAILSSAQLSTYDYAKRLSIRRGIAKDGPLLHLAASVVAAASAVTAMIPADVVLTTYQGASATGSGAYSSVWGCARAMYAKHGYLIFSRGWTFMFARMLPSSLLSFLLYEQVRALLGLDYLD